MSPPRVSWMDWRADPDAAPIPHRRPRGASAVGVVLRPEVRQRLVRVANASGVTTSGLLAVGVSRLLADVERGDPDKAFARIRAELAGLEARSP